MGKGHEYDIYRKKKHERTKKHVNQGKENEISSIFQGTYSLHSYEKIKKYPQ